MFIPSSLFYTAYIEYSVGKLVHFYMCSFRLFETSFKLRNLRTQNVFKFLNKLELKIVNDPKIG